MVQRLGMIIESDRLEDLNAPVAQGKPPTYWYRCAVKGCTTSIVEVHKYWPFCAKDYFNQPPRRRDAPFEVPG